MKLEAALRSLSEKMLSIKKLVVQLLEEEPEESKVQGKANLVTTMVCVCSPSHCVCCAVGDDEREAWPEDDDSARPGSPQGDSADEPALNVLREPLLDEL